MEWQLIVLDSGVTRCFDLASLQSRDGGGVKTHYAKKKLRPYQLPFALVAPLCPKDDVDYPFVSVPRLLRGERLLLQHVLLVHDDDSHTRQEEKKKKRPT